MLITDLIEYFRDLSNRHIEIKGFLTGEKYELNQSNIDYPLIFLRTDFVSKMSSAINEITTDYVFLNFNLYIFGLSQERNDNVLSNYIDTLNVYTKQDTTIDDLFRYFNHILSQFVEDCDGVLPYQILDISNNIVSKRVLVDDCEGWEVAISIKTHNIYNCEKELFFTPIFNTQK